MDNIGDELRLRRLLGGVYQSDIAKAAGISQGLLSRIERGYKTPSSELVGRIRAAIDVLRKEAAMKAKAILYGELEVPEEAITTIENLNPGSLLHMLMEKGTNIETEVEAVTED